MKKMIVILMMLMIGLTGTVWSTDITFNKINTMTDVELSSVRGMNTVTIATLYVSSPTGWQVYAIPGTQTLTGYTTGSTPVIIVGSNFNAALKATVTLK